MRSFLLASLVFFIAMTLGILPLRADTLGAPEPIVLRDFLNRNWTNERLVYRLTPNQIIAISANQVLVDKDNRSPLYQIHHGQPATLELLTDLSPFETKTFRFVPASQAAAAPQTDLKITETPTHIRLTNAKTGILIRKSLNVGEGPIAGIQLASGKWIGTSQLLGRPTASTTQSTTNPVTGDPEIPIAPADYSAMIIRSGPVSAQIRCAMTLVDGSTCEMTFTLNAFEPAVLINENFSQWNHPTLQLIIDQTFPASNILYRTGKDNVGELRSWKIPPKTDEFVYVLEPWLRWWVALRQGNWFALYNDTDSDMLTIGALSAGSWISPEQFQLAKVGLSAQDFKNRPQLRPSVLTRKNDSLVLSFPAVGTHRAWLIGTQTKQSSLAILNGKDRFQAPPPQELIIKHGDFPLELIKDYALTWPSEQDQYPHLVFNREQIASMRSLHSSIPSSARTNQITSQPLSAYNLDEVLTYYLTTGDPVVGKFISDESVKMMQSAVDMYTHQDNLVTIGFAPHHQTIVISAVCLADIALGDHYLSPQLRQRLLAQAAFLGYTTSRPDYWDPHRGYSANPNMTTTVATFQGIVACLIPSHPWAKNWLNASMDELYKEQLLTWSDDNGGWLEAPHYAMVSYDYLLGLFLMARNTGLVDHTFDPKMKKVAEWFAKISTPPDSRVNGWRHQPPIGNTYILEPTGNYGLIAHIWKDKDPVFAAQMQWMFEQSGKFPAPGCGGFFPTTASYHTLLTQPAITSRKPDYQSELFPQTGVILRNHFGTDRETQLLLIAGNHRAHYDDDSGSFTLWGKGRIIADDFGYYGRAPANDHSLIESPTAVGAKIMEVKTFKPDPLADYVRAVKQSWTRQILMIKSPDPLGPNYYIISDTVDPDPQLKWRLWLTASKVTPNAQSVHIEGKEDIDTDLFFASPQNVPLALEDKTRISGSSFKNNATPSTQIGLISGAPGIGNFTFALFPHLKSQKPPLMTTIADGHGIKVESEFATDYIFLSSKPISAEIDGLKFKGTVGIITQRDGKFTGLLPEDGEITGPDGLSLRSPAH